MPAAILGPVAAEAYTIRIVGTSDIADSNLYAGLINSTGSNGYAASPFFATGDSLSYTAVGTGAALNSARAGNADIVLVHSPLLESTFVSQGYSNEPLGRSLFYNNYVIVGPTGDPAHVATNFRHDAVGAYAAIAAQGGGAGGGGNATFEPQGSGGAGTFPDWYKFSNTTQGANVQLTNDCPVATFPDGGCYTMTDLGTYQYLSSQNKVPISGRAVDVRPRGRFEVTSLAALARYISDVLLGLETGLVPGPTSAVEGLAVNVVDARGQRVSEWINGRDGDGGGAGDKVVPLPSNADVAFPDLTGGPALAPQVHSGEYALPGRVVIVRRPK